MKRSDVAQNAKWIVGCKIVQCLIQLVIGMLTARYLGPSNYGLISYASSLVAFAIPVMQLGLRTTLVQEYVNYPDEEGEILGTSLVMNMLASAACIIGVVSFSAIANPGETETILICLLYSLSLIAQALEMIQYWFQAKLLSKFPSVAMLCAYVVVAVYKFLLLATQQSVYWFAVSHAIEYCLVGIALLGIYFKLGNQKLSFSFQIAKRLFNKGKYYIMSGLMVTIFQNTDHVMLKQMVGDMENGFYTTAVTCAGMTSFVFMAIIDSARPVILESRKRDMAEFEQNMSGLYTVIIYLALAQSVCFVLLADPIVKILYGTEYLSAIPVLRIIVWYTAFSCMGTVRNIWILAEGKQSFLWIINLSGALANIALNALMIPHWGACGAALASVITQFFTNFIVGFIIPAIRPNNKLLIKGLNPRLLLDYAGRYGAAFAKKLRGKR